MPIDPLAHVASGDPLELYAGQMNAWTDAARAERLRKHNRDGGIHRDEIHPSLHVIVRNDTGADLPARSVVRADDWVVTPVTFPYEVADRPILIGNTPNASSNQVAILRDAIPNGAMGRGIIAGVAVVDILVNDATHTYAQPINGDSTKLTSATGGIARLLKWETSGSTRRAIMLLGDGTTATAASELKGLTFTSDTDSTSDSDPGAGLFKWNHATQDSATFLYFNNLTADGISAATFYVSCGLTGFLHLQQADNSAIWQLWKWTALPVNGTNYYKFAVSLQAKSVASIADAKTVYADFSPDNRIDISGRSGSLINVTAAQFLRTIVTGTAEAAVVTPDDASISLPGDVNLTEQQFQGLKLFLKGLQSYTGTLVPARVISGSLSIGSMTTTTGLFGGCMMPIIAGGITALEVGQFADGSRSARLANYDNDGLLSAAYVDPVYSITVGAAQVNGVTGTLGPGCQSRGGLVTAAGSGNFTSNAAALTSNGIVLGGGGNAVSTTAAPTSGQILIGQAGAPSPQTVSGDATLAASGAVTVASAAGAFSFLGDITPTTLAANTNDYNPTGW